MVQEQSNIDSKRAEIEALVEEDKIDEARQCLDNAPLGSLSGEDQQICEALVYGAEYPEKPPKEVVGQDDADLESLTKDELVVKAQALNITGTSSMTKADLIEAIEEATDDNG